MDMQTKSIACRCPSYDWAEIWNRTSYQPALLTNEESKGVRLSFADDKLTLTSRAPEMGEATVEVNLEDYQGDPLEIGFNPNFIADALNVVDTGKVVVELKSATKPGVLKTGSDFTYAIMPINLQ
jgi:DNA polymerase-3 subunit beta